MESLTRAAGPIFTTKLIILIPVRRSSTEFFRQAFGPCPKLPPLLDILRWGAFKGMRAQPAATAPKEHNVPRTAAAAPNSAGAKRLEEQRAQHRFSRPQRCQHRSVHSCLLNTLEAPDQEPNGAVPATHSVLQLPTVAR